MTGPVYELIAAWLAWETVAARPPKRPSSLWLKAEVDRKETAIGALDLPACHTHELVATARRAGYSVTDAVMTAVNELGYREAS